MLTKIFGEKPRIKILEFLLNNTEYDYSISEIVTKTNVSKPTVKKILSELWLEKIITRRVLAGAKLYKIDITNNTVKALIVFEENLVSCEKCAKKKINKLM